MIVCNKCGAQNNDDNLYCISCHQLFQRNPAGTGKRPVEQSTVKSIGGGATGPVDRSKARRQSSGSAGRKPPRQAADASTKGRGYRDPSRMDREKRAAGTSKYSLMNKIFGVLFFITVPAMLYLAYFILSLSAKTKEEAVKPLNTKASSMFVEAENHFNSKRYLAAQNLYIQFMDEFPEDPLSEIVSRRIRQINNGLLTVEEEAIYRKHRLKLLSERVELAYEKRQYVKPPNDNVIGYVTEILALDPENQRAAELRDRVIAYLEGEGRQAFAAEEFERAREFYEYLLAVVPGHRGARIQLGRIREAIAEREAREKARIADSLRQAEEETQPIFASNDNPPAGGLTSTRPETLSAPPASSPLREESRPAEETFRRPTQSTAQPARTDAAPATGEREGEEKQESEEPSRVETPPPAEKSAEPVEKPPLPVFNEPVIESFLDGGQRDYIVKATPEYPRKLRSTRLSGTVLMEVTVRKDGRVAGYRVLQSHHEAFTEACIEALRSFRYRPGTINGVPVSFKVIERFEFKVVD